MEKMYSELDEELSKHGKLDFCDFERAFAKRGIEYHGGLVIEGPKPGTFLWSGWSQNAIEIYFDYKSSRNLVNYPTDVLTYGKLFDAPIANLGHSYKTDHWMPVVIVAKEEAQKRLNNLAESLIKHDKTN